jgi:nucleotide-binding universal stress UspA family protein
MKILLPVDGSRCALNAVRLVAERLWPRAEGLELLLLHVHYRIPNRAAAAAGRELVENYYRKGAEEALAAACAVLDRGGVTYKVKRVLGSPGEAIAQTADASGADLIAIGSHGLGAAKGLLLGSVTQTVIGECRTPLLVVREGHLPPPDGEVLVAIDGSAHTRRALGFLLRHRQWLAPRGRITFMHVSPSSPALAAGRQALAAEQRAEFEHALRDARRLADKAGVRYKSLHVSGNPGERIANHARGSHSSLLVMGSHGRGGLGSLLLGSVAQKALAGCNTPTLIVR